jgi:hypothetical protein
LPHSRFVSCKETQAQVCKLCNSVREAIIQSYMGCTGEGQDYAVSKERDKKYV